MSRRSATEAVDAADAAHPTEDWAQIPWRKLEQSVYRLQKRIYRATQQGKLEVVHSLQRLLMKSRAARTLAVRRVTQDNQGKRTAGIDGVHSVPPPQRWQMVARLRTHQHIKAQPTRRVWIPKPGKDEQRPLGIPTMLDRAHQTLAKLALEPEWEARFEANSYGFRPGRSAHDAIEAIFSMIQHRPKYVLDADIAQCFDAIDHAALLTKLQTYPTMYRAIKAWLRAGVLEKDALAPTSKGTPQGGCISPLLANIALHGLETALHALTIDRAHPMVVRYADDFVVFHPTREGIEHARTVASTWLAHLGLTLKPSKTRLTHTLETVEDTPPGFTFLGFHIRQYPVGYHRSGTSHGRRLGFKTLIRPSPEAIKRHLDTLRGTIKAGRGLRQVDLIRQLNPQIQGWAQYYRSVVASEAFRDCDNALFPCLLRWAKRRHPRKAARWVVSKYWRISEHRVWRFTPPKGPRLIKHADSRIHRHIKVKGTASPYDGKLVYWAKRLRDHPLTRNVVSQLLRLQMGKCNACGLHFREDDQIEVDHLVPRELGGSDQLINLQALHRHCHDQRHAQASGIRDKNDRTEEPDDRKRSRPVLEPSGRGDPVA